MVGHSHYGFYFKFLSNGDVKNMKKCVKTLNVDGIPFYREVISSHISIQDKEPYFTCQFDLYEQN